MPTMQFIIENRRGNGKTIQLSVNHDMSWPTSSSHAITWYERVRPLFVSSSPNTDDHRRRSRLTSISRGYTTIQRLCTSPQAADGADNKPHCAKKRYSKQHKDTKKQNRIIKSRGKRYRGKWCHANIQQTSNRCLTNLPTQWYTHT